MRRKLNVYQGSISCLLFCFSIWLGTWGVSIVTAYQGDNEWSSTDIPKGTGALPPSLKSVQGNSVNLRAYCIVPSGWTDASGPNVVTQSISLLIPESFPKGRWWVNGQSLGSPIRVSSNGEAMPGSNEKVSYQRLAVPYGVLKKDRLAQVDVEIDGEDLKGEGTIAAPNLASYHEEISLAGAWLLTSKRIESIRWDDPPQNYKPFDKVMPGTAPLAAPTEFQPTRHLEPDDSLKAMMVTEGLKVEQVLAEPKVGQPVGMTFDSQGRLWVAEYRQYPYPAGMKIVSRDKFYRAVYDIFPDPPPRGPRGNDRISVHEDSDGDGTFDKHYTFIDGLNLASSVLPTADGAWVLNPPYLLLYRDADKNFRADGAPEVHLTGFGLEDTHSVANSLRLGPDGWIYGAMGSTVSSSIVVAGRDDPPLQCEGAAIWRYHPSTKRYEIFAEGGGNAFCVTFDAEGRLYSGHNGNDTRGFHYWQGAYYRKDEFKHGVVSNPYAYGFLNFMQHPPTPRFSHALVRYGDTILPPRFQQQLLAVDPLKGTVVLSSMTPKGGTFATEDLENSLSTQDFAFRPVDIQVGPDGNIYVADLCEEFIAHGQHYLGMLDSNTGRVYRLSNANGISRPLNTLASLTKMNLDELLKQLESPSQSIRDIAREWIISNRDLHIQPELLTALRDRLAKGQAHSPLESLWILHRLSAMRREEWTLGLNHSNSAVRMWTVRLIGDWEETSREYASDLQELAKKETSPEVLCQLACTAKRLAASDAVAIMTTLVTKDSLADDPNYGLLLWWGIEPHLDSGRRELMTWLSDPAVWKSSWLVNFVSERIARKLLSTQARIDAADVAKMFRAALTAGTTHTAGLQRGFEQGTATRVSLDIPTELVEAVLASGGGSLSLRLRLNDAAAKRESLEKLRDSKTSVAEKLSLIQTIGLIRDRSFENFLVETLLSDQPMPVRLEALYSLEAIASSEVERQLPQLASLPSDIRVAVLRVLARREVTGLKILDAIEKGTLAISEINQETRELLASHTAPELQKKIQRLIPEKMPLDDETTRRELNRWGKILDVSGGNPYQGKTLFLEHCGKCHKLFNEGGDIGPELTRYNRDDRNTMLLSILRPSQEIREGFRTFQALTVDGRVVTGFVVDDNEEIVTLREASGQSITLAKADIEEYKATPKSIMPEGLLDKLSEDQVRDLFSYLQSGQPLGR